MDRRNNGFGIEKKGIVYSTLFWILAALLIALVIFALYSIISGKAKNLFDILELILG